MTSIHGLLKPAVWNDAMPGLESISFRAEQYRKLLEAVSILLDEEYEDDGENHYLGIDAFKGNSLKESLSEVDCVLATCC